jgi:hypothetical protein
LSAIATLFVMGGALLFAWFIVAWLAQVVGLVDNGESLLWCGGLTTC